MPTKEVFIEQVRQGIIAGDATAEKKDYLHPDVLNVFISDAITDVYWAIFKQNPTELDFYGRNFNSVVIKCDTISNTYYCDLPKPVIQFPNGEGVRQVGELRGRLKFSRTDLNKGSLMGDMLIGKMKKDVGFILTNNRIEFVDFDEYVGVNEVFLNIVIPFSEYEDEDWISLPAGKELDIINMVKGIIIQRLSDDKQNDATFNPQTK